MAILYRIINKVTADYFVGISISKQPPHKLYFRHTDIKREKRNDVFQKALESYDRTDFMLQIIRETDDPKDLYDEYDKLFLNAAYNGNKRRRPIKSVECYTKTEETRQNMSRSHQGHKPTSKTLEARYKGMMARYAVATPEVLCKTYYVLHNGEIIKGLAKEFKETFGFDVCTINKSKRKWKAFYNLETVPLTTTLKIVTIAEYKNKI